MRFSPAAAVLAVWLAACAAPAPSGGELPFTTIENKDDPAYIGQQQYNALDPGLLVLLDAESASANEELFSEAARETLGQVDWRVQFVVAVFRGWQGGSGYGVTIRRLLLVGATIRVEAEFLSPEDDPSGSVTSPYHLIAVRRPLTPVERIAFELMVEDEIVLTATAVEP